MARKYDTSSNPTVEIRDITDIIKPDYISYAVALYLRSIPNAIDGLKPVQRRILYTMFINKIFNFEKKDLFQIESEKRENIKINL